MLSDPGLWLIIAGMLLVMVGFFGLAFSQNRKALDQPIDEQLPQTAIDQPKQLGQRSR
jgi:hypothetical protein